MKKASYEGLFKGKKITVMGLGLLGRGLGDIVFLAECGADLIVTDLKSKEQLKPSLKKLSKYKNIKFTLEEHKLEDFRDRDFVLRAPNAPIGSPYLAEARNHGVQVKLSTSLFAEYAPGVVLVGVTGTRGKTTTTMLIYSILLEAYKKSKTKVFLGGNIQGVSTLALFKKVKPGDIVVCELDSWQMQAFGEARISPHVAVFTNLLKDHMNYYMSDGVSEDVAMGRYFVDKTQIFLHQKTSDYIVTTDQVVGRIVESKPQGKLVLARKESFPSSWKRQLLGEHNTINIACAVEATRAIGISDALIKKVVARFGGVPGRMEHMRTIKGVKIYNDTCATTPDATVVALNALVSTLKPGRKIVLIWGGADKKLDMSRLVMVLKNNPIKQVMLSGTGTDAVRALYFELSSQPVFHSLSEAVSAAIGLAKSGDIVILSPAFASFGMFKNEYDRGDQFDKLVKNL